MSHAHVEWFGVKTYLLNDLVDFISCYSFHFLAPEVLVGTSSNMLLIIHYMGHFLRLAMFISVGYVQSMSLRISFICIIFLCHHRLLKMRTWKS